VLQGIRACLAEAYGSDSLKGRHITVQGVGEVGYWVVKYAIESGAKVTIADINKESKVPHSSWPINMQKVT
jgi:leucine dehydrogenase